MGLAESTQRTYKSGKDRYLKFCLQAGMRSVPTCEQVLCGFVAHLSNEHLKYRTIKVYLAAVRHLHISVAQPNPFGGNPPMTRLEYVLRGIKKNEVALQKGERERLPITPPLLRQIKAQWEPDGMRPDKKMLWAACCMFFRLSAGRGDDSPLRRRIRPSGASELERCRHRRPARALDGSAHHQTVQNRPVSQGN